MVSRAFFKAGHPPTLFAAFFYFDMSFMVWVILGPLGVQIAQDLHLDAAQRGLMVAVPLLAGALLRVVNGVLVDRIGPLRTGMIGQVIVIAGLLSAWWFGIHSLSEVLLLGVVLGVAGASFAVALPLASRWYPPELQGIALGIAGAGNSGVVFAALFAPGLAAAYGWTNVLGLAAIPLIVAFITYVVFARESPERPPAKTLAQYLAVFRIGDAWWFMLFYGVTFGGFSGLASSLPIYFHDQYGLDPKVAGYFAAACVFAGSLVRPVGGTLADRIGGIRALSMMYTVAAVAIGVVSFGLPQAWMALSCLHRRHAGPRDGQRLGVPAGAAALPPGDRRHDRAGRHDRRHRRVLSGVLARLFEAVHRLYQAGLLVFATLAVVALVGIFA